MLYAIILWQTIFEYYNIIVYLHHDNDMMMRNKDNSC